MHFPNDTFDVVVCSDVLEHITDLRKVLREFRRVLRPGGLLLVDTINRTLLAYIVAVLGAEYILGAIPRLTHDWRLFIKPDELSVAFADTGFNLHHHASNTGPFPGFRPSVTMIWDVFRA